MRVFVLGAGASIHAGYPGGATLGEELAAWTERDHVEGHLYRETLQQVRKEFGGLADFERILTVLYEQKENGKRLTIPDFGSAIAYFLNSIRNRPAELYDRFAFERVTAGDCVITFNYDLAVERSLRTAGLWDINDGYGKAFALAVRERPLSNVSVLKLHGSTNWWGSIFNGATGYGACQNSLGDRPVLFFEPDFTFLGHEHLRDPKAPTRSGLVSAVICPSLNKEFYKQTTFGNEWERFWNSLWWEAQRAIRQADEIVIIGYSMPLADERARDLLLRQSNHKASITICCHAQSEKIAREFISNQFTRVHVPDDPTFGGWLDATRRSTVGLPNGEAEREGIALSSVRSLLASKKTIQSAENPLCPSVWAEPAIESTLEQHFLERGSYAGEPSYVLQGWSMPVLFFFANGTWFSGGASEEESLAAYLRRVKEVYVERIRPVIVGNPEVGAMT